MDEDILATYTVTVTLKTTGQEIVQYDITTSTPEQAEESVWYMIPYGSENKYKISVVRKP